ncbi:MAG: glycosyltransferase family 2 protein [Bacteroidota bacterium]
MLSICIPIYNFDVKALAEALHKQLPTEAEIIFIDDASTPHFRALNQPHCEAVGSYIQLTQNIGRAQIRNRFLAFAQHDWLLFLDCDSLIAVPNFLYKYVQIIQSGFRGVICGGRSYGTKPPDPQQSLRWTYGVSLESQSAPTRSQRPYASFMTNNFVVLKEVLEQIPFEEKLTTYGHEDTLFGVELEQAQIPIIHIENAILNGDIETNEIFVQKTEVGIANLHRIIRLIEDPQRFIERVNLLRFNQRLQKSGLEFLIWGVYRLVRKMLRKRLIQGPPSMRLFSFYKWGYFREVGKALR